MDGVDSRAKLGIWSGDGRECDVGVGAGTLVLRLLATLLLRLKVEIGSLARLWVPAG